MKILFLLIVLFVYFVQCKDIYVGKGTSKDNLEIIFFVGINKCRIEENAQIMEINGCKFESFDKICFIRGKDKVIQITDCTFENNEEKSQSGNKLRENIPSEEAKEENLIKKEFFPDRVAPPREKKGRGRKYKGQKGERGKKGDPGLPGADGLNGYNGLNGKRGKQGKPGKTGDKGSKGDPGYGYAGPRGDTGIQGSTGFTGPIGPTGIQGATGNEGATGLQGLTGPQGYTGPQGPTGVTGQTGLKGDKGEIGDQGPKGNDGEDGKPGKKGDKGEVGQKGRRGKHGIQGRRGRTGEKGEVGPQGERGKTGDTGLKGSRGREGKQGFKGSRGRRGEQGFKGNDGDRGEKGDVGEQGPIGRQGKKGTKGTKGEQGDRGLRGFRGVRGERGFRGKTGHKGQKGESSYVEKRVAEDIGFERSQKRVFLVPNVSEIPQELTLLNPQINLMYVSNGENTFGWKESKIIKNVDQTFTETCGSDRVVISGKCQMNVFNFVKKLSPCLVSDFDSFPCKQDQVNCISSITPKDGEFNNQQLPLVESLKFINTLKEEVVLSPLCTILQTSDLSQPELDKCGYFCYIHQLDAEFISESSFSCKYNSPSEFKDSHVVSISIQTFCGDKENEVSKDGTSTHPLTMSQELLNENKVLTLEVESDHKEIEELKNEQKLEKEREEKDEETLALLMQEIAKLKKLQDQQNTPKNVDLNNSIESKIN